jgi:hypothetical protein
MMMRKRRRRRMTVMSIVVSRSKIISLDNDSTARVSLIPP